MKRLVLIPLLIAAILLTLPALAAGTEEEWNASCNWVITQDTTLYSAVHPEDATGTDLLHFEPFGTIAAGARVSIRSTYGPMREILCWRDGMITAWVESAAIRWAVDTPESAHATQSSGVWADFAVTLRIGKNETKPVTLEVLGTAQSVVFDGTEMLTVPTRDLLWESQVPENQRLAIINAPKTGKATLRASASTKAKSIGQCEAGRIVVVLKSGSSFSRILYDGKEGCVLTDALILCGAVPETDYTAATLCYKGRTDSSAAISVYTSKDANRKIMQQRVGSDVIKLGESGSWAEIELDGWRGWCKSSYLQ